MARGFTQSRYTKILPEQVLAYFDIDIDENNKCICPFHAEDIPSMQVNKEYVYCYGCQWSGDVWRLASSLLDSVPNIGAWLQTTNFPSPSGRIFKKSGYTGGVNISLIDYWHNCLLERPELLSTLRKERLLIPDTAKRFKLGYRPDRDAWVIPFMYQGEAEIVQFRSRKTDEAGAKYWGLEGHNKGCIINRVVLDTPQDYVVVLMGAFDPQLATQDGLIAVGMNGSFPFKKTEKEYVQQLFNKQKIKFIVPDNNEVEIKAANKLANWIDGDVRIFPKGLPHNTDYIDYRKTGKTVEDFKRQVLNILPYEDISTHPSFPSLCSLYDAADMYNFSLVYLEMIAKGYTYHDIGLAIANNHITDLVPRRMMYNVQCMDDFTRAMKYNYIKAGGW